MATKMRFGASLAWIVRSLNFLTRLLTHLRQNLLRIFVEFCKLCMYVFILDYNCACRRITLLVSMQTGINALQLMLAKKRIHMYSEA